MEIGSYQKALEFLGKSEDYFSFSIKPFVDEENNDMLRVCLYKHPRSYRSNEKELICSGKSTDECIDYFLNFEPKTIRESLHSKFHTKTSGIISKIKGVNKHWPEQKHFQYEDRYYCLFIEFMDGFRSIARVVHPAQASDIKVGDFLDVDDKYSKILEHRKLPMNRTDYEKLKLSGIMWEIYPDFTGDYDKDILSQNSQDGSRR